MKKTFIFLTFLLLILATQAKHHKKEKNKKCNNAKLISCVSKIENTIKDCASNADPKECVYSLMVDDVCYGCIDKVLPHFTEVENHDHRKQKHYTNEQDEEIGNEGVDINNLINSYATCGKKEMFQCRNKINKIVKGCQNEKNSGLCVHDILANNTCKVCICTISPISCEKQEIQKEESIKDKLASTDIFGFLKDIGNTYREVRNKRTGDKEEESSYSKGFKNMFGNLGELANKNTLNDLGNLAETMQGLGSLGGLAGGLGGLGGKSGGFGGKKPEQQEKKQEGFDIGSMAMNPAFLTTMQTLLQDPRKTEGLINQLKMDEKKVEGEESNYDNMQQQLLQQVMSNPELLEQFLGKEYDTAQLQELLKEDKPAEQPTKAPQAKEESEYSDLDTEDSESSSEEDEEVQEKPSGSISFDAECKNEQQFEQCKWKILKIMPSCIQQNAKKCATKLMGNHPCSSCLCRFDKQLC